MSNVNVVSLVVVGLAVAVAVISNKTKKPAARANRNLHVFNENVRLFNEQQQRAVNQLHF